MLYNEQNNFRRPPSAWLPRRAEMKGKVPSLAHHYHHQSLVSRAAAASLRAWTLRGAPNRVSAQGLMRKDALFAM